MMTGMLKLGNLARTTFPNQMLTKSHTAHTADWLELYGTRVKGWAVEGSGLVWRRAWTPVQRASMDIAEPNRTATRQRIMFMMNFPLGRTTRAMMGNEKHATLNGLHWGASSAGWLYVVTLESGAAVVMRRSFFRVWAPLASSVWSSPSKDVRIFCRRGARAWERGLMQRQRPRRSHLQLNQGADSPSLSSRLRHH